MNTNKTEEIKVLAGLALACAVLALVFKIKVFSYLCIIFLFIGLLGGKPSHFIAKIWTAVTHFIGKVITKTAIFIAYYFCLTPIAVLYRIFNKKHVKDFFGDKTQPSYFKDINKKYEKKDLQQLW